MGEKKITYEDYEEAKSILGESVPISTYEVPQDGTNNDKFRFIADSFKKPEVECASACKCYMERAAAVGKLDEAEKEIRRLLSICSNRYPHKDNHPESEAKEIMALYTLASDTDQLYTKDHANNKESVEIQRMKHLLNIIDRHSRGELSSEDVTELKGNCESWINDIEKLAEMVCSLNRDFVV